MSSERVNESSDFAARGVQKYSIEERLPSLRSFRFEIDEYEDGYSKLDSFLITESNMPEAGMLVCKHNLCHSEGVSLEGIVTEMLKDKVRNRALSKKCGGKLTSPKGRRAHGSCNRSFEIKVHLDLKPAPRSPGLSVPA
ncbi:MAG TPA: hypothetical protein VL354_18635 [Spirochaetia bacterium]|nr:hypothetical protein [Spirochaetia bacterium]